MPNEAGPAEAAAADVVGAYLALERIVNAWADAERRFEQAWDLTSVQLRVLRQLASAPGACVKQVAAATGRDQGTTSVIVARLEVRGLVTRDRCDADHRRSLLSITDAGRRIVAMADSEGPRRIADAVARLSEFERRQLAECLARLAHQVSVAGEIASVSSVCDGKGR